MNFAISIFLTLMTVAATANAKMVSSSTGLNLCPTGEVKVLVQKNMLSNAELQDLEGAGFLLVSAGDYYVVNSPVGLYRTSNACESFETIKDHLEGTVHAISVSSAVVAFTVSTAPMSLTVLLAGSATMSAVIFATDKFICREYFQKRDEKRLKQMIQEGTCEILKKQNGGVDVCNSSGGNLVKTKESFEKMCTPIMMGPKT